MADRWYPHIQPDEFENPNKISQKLIDLLWEIRMKIGLPMYFSKYHPHGDAVPPDSTAHSAKSLHKWGIDHTSSALAVAPVKNKTFLAKAVDFDVEVETYADLVDVFLDIDSIADIGGLGIYPQWRRPGFHIDIRTRKHPLHGARWVAWYDRRKNKQIYKHLTAREIVKIVRMGRIKK